MSDLQWLFTVLYLAVFAMVALGAWDNRKALGAAFRPRAADRRKAK